LPDAVRWLLVGSLAVALVSVVVIARTLETHRRLSDVYRPAEMALLASALLCLVVGLTDWGAKASLTALVVLLLAPVAAGLYVWLKRTEPRTMREASQQNS
jgi:ABC-type proline/glycine betaine transport system permease subunit